MNRAFGEWLIDEGGGLSELQIYVYQSYEIKEELKKLEYRWDPVKRAWGKSLLGSVSFLEQAVDEELEELRRLEVSI